MWQNLPEMIAALTFFGLFVICPLVILFLRHQRQMAELIHRNPDNEALRRLEIVEHELRELKAVQYEFMLQSDDKKGIGPGDTI